ncbi:hypothetical protein Bpfe_011286, partial [Biomphalaria pfeifferi]
PRRFDRIAFQDTYIDQSLFFIQSQHFVNIDLLFCDHHMLRAKGRSEALTLDPTLPDTLACTISWRHVYQGWVSYLWIIQVSYLWIIPVVADEYDFEKNDW